MSRQDKFNGDIAVATHRQESSVRWLVKHLSEHQPGLGCEGLDDMQRRAPSSRIFLLRR